MFGMSVGLVATKMRSSAHPQGDYTWEPHRPTSLACAPRPLLRGLASISLRPSGCHFWRTGAAPLAPLLDRGNPFACRILQSRTHTATSKLPPTWTTGSGMQATTITEKRTGRGEASNKHPRRSIRSRRSSAGVLGFERTNPSNPQNPSDETHGSRWVGSGAKNTQIRERRRRSPKNRDDSRRFEPLLDFG